MLLFSSRKPPNVSFTNKQSRIYSPITKFEAETDVCLCIDVANQTLRAYRCREVDAISDSIGVISYLAGWQNHHRLFGAQKEEVYLSSLVAMSFIEKSSRLLFVRFPLEFICFPLRPIKHCSSLRQPGDPPSRSLAKHSVPPNPHVD